MISRLKGPLGVDLAGVTVCLGLGALAIMLGVMPGVQSARRTDMLREQHQALSDELRKRLARAEAFDRRLADAEAMIASGVSLRSSSEINRVVAELAALARSSGCTVSRTQPGESARDGKLIVTAITLAGAGTPARVDSLLRALRAERPDIRVIGVDLTHSDVTEHDLRFSLDLRWRCLPDGFAGGAAGAGRAGEPG